MSPCVDVQVQGLHLRFVLQTCDRRVVEAAEGDTSLVNLRCFLLLRQLLQRLERFVGQRHANPLPLAHLHVRLTVDARLVDEARFKRQDGKGKGHAEIQFQFGDQSVFPVPR